MDYFVKYNDVQRVLMQGSTKTSVVLNDELQVDLRVVKDDSFGAALQYFTGSKEHNVKMRSIAIKNGFKLNEYGLFDKETEKYIVGKNEEDIYNKLDLSYIEPELRENRGEIEVASEKKLPNLVEYNELKGDLHIHSNWSDGFETIETLANHSQKMGYEYIGIADHSQSLKVARGLSEERIIKKLNEVEKINKKLSNFRIFCGTECDIKSDGTLDYSNKVLKKLDYVFAAIHTNFKMGQKEATQRIIKGIENEYTTAIAHPTCRIIRRREPFDLDIERIFDAAIDTGTYLEINSFPDRLDLNDYYSKIAKDKGAEFVIGTDAHHINQLSFVQYGISTARRGWLEKKDILNTHSLIEVEKILGRD
jgi:DNA polymerase (family 10)